MIGFIPQYTQWFLIIYSYLYISCIFVYPSTNDIRFFFYKNMKTQNPVVVGEWRGGRGIMWLTKGARCSPLLNTPPFPRPSAQAIDCYPKPQMDELMANNNLSSLVHIFQFYLPFNLIAKSNCFLPAVPLTIQSP